MPNVRPMNSKYGISKHKFLQVYHFCMQYNEPRGSGGSGRPTEDLAIRRAQLAENVQLVEQTCMEADGDIYQWLLKAVTNEGVGYTYLKEYMEIPCGKDMYYDRRRKFYWLMAQKI